MLGDRQRAILELLTARGGGLCLEVIIRALAELPTDRREIVRAINRLADVGRVEISGKQARARPGSVIRLMNQPERLQSSLLHMSTDL